MSGAAIGIAPGCEAFLSPLPGDPKGRGGQRTSEAA